RAGARDAAVGGDRIAGEAGRAAGAARARRRSDAGRAHAAAARARGRVAAAADAAAAGLAGRTRRAGAAGRGIAGKIGRRVGREIDVGEVRAPVGGEQIDGDGQVRDRLRNGEV